MLFWSIFSRNKGFYYVKNEVLWYFFNSSCLTWSSSTHIGTFQLKEGHEIWQRYEIWMMEAKRTTWHTTEVPWEAWRKGINNNWELFFSGITRKASNKTWSWEVQMREVTVFILLVSKTMELSAFSYECLQALKNTLEIFFLEIQPFHFFLKRSYISLQHCIHGWDYGWSCILIFSEACKTYRHAEKHEWGHKVLFWLVTVFWHF